MGFFKIIGEFIQALPEVLRLINSLMTAFKEAKRTGAIRDINAALDKSAVAKTPEERSRAMLDLVRAVSKPR